MELDKLSKQFADIPTLQTEERKKKEGVARMDHMRANLEKT